MKFSIIVTGEGQGCQARFGNRDGELLAQLADDRVLRRLALLDFAAGEFPQAGHGLAVRPLGDEDALVGIDQRAGGDQQQRRHAQLR
jgi:hypothetical protein